MPLVATATEEAERRLITPSKVASINLCMDQLLWQMLPAERLVSVSYLAADPIWSTIAPAVNAANIALNRGLVEELVPLSPDLILAGEYDSRQSDPLLARLGLSIKRIPAVYELADVSQQVRMLGEWVDAKLQAEHIASELDAALATLAQHRLSSPKRVLWYTANGVVVGKGTLEDQLLERAGLHNAASERGISGFQALDLEQLLMADPDIILVESGFEQAFSLADSVLTHPALSRSRAQVASIPSGISGCPATSIPALVPSFTELLKRLSNTASSSDPLL